MEKRYDVDQVSYTIPDWLVEHMTNINIHLFLKFWVWFTAELNSLWKCFRQRLDGTLSNLI